MPFHALCVLLKGQSDASWPEDISINVGYSISTGVTFKQAKGEAAKKSWSPLEREGDRDTLYWLNGSDYQPLEHQAWTSIESGVAKL